MTAENELFLCSDMRAANPATSLKLTTKECQSNMSGNFYLRMQRKKINHQVCVMFEIA